MQLQMIKCITQILWNYHRIVYKLFSKFYCLYAIPSHMCMKNSLAIIPLKNVYVTISLGDNVKASCAKSIQYLWMWATYIRRESKEVSQEILTPLTPMGVSDQNFFSYDFFLWINFDEIWIPHLSIQLYETKLKSWLQLLQEVAQNPTVDRKN